MKRILCVLISVLLIFSATLPMAASAATESNLYIDSYSGEVTPLGNGRIKVNFSTYGTHYMDDIGASQIILYENGTVVKTYSAYNPLYSATMFGHNRWYFYGYVYYDGNVGDSYYATIVHYAGDSTGHGTEGLTTFSVVAT